MNTALIFAGGSGTRMNSKTKPKQFLELNGKAIIIHTIEYFERCSEIDNIAVVCIADWIDYFKELLKKNFITKVKWVVPGGSTGQESIYNGLKAIYDALEQVTPRQKEIFLMVLVEDMSYSEIGRKLSISKMTVCESYNSCVDKIKEICKNF